MNAQLNRLGRWLKVNGWRDLGLPLTVYTLVAIGMTWPLVIQLSTHVGGPEYADSFEYMRLGWWGKYALQHGLNPFYQSMFGYPDGFFSATQWSQPLIYLPISFLGLFVNPPAAFNLWLLLETILNGLTAYWLCRDILRESPRSTVLGLFGGLIFMAYPAMQGHILAGHINPLANYGFPVLVLCTYRIIERRGGLRTAFAGSFAILILALGNFTFPAFLFLPFILFGGVYLFLFRRSDLLNRATLRYLLIMLLGGVLLMFPFYAPLAADIFSSSRPAYLDATGWVYYSADLLSFAAPSPFNPLITPVLPSYSWTVLGTNIVEGSAYLGVVALILSTIAVWKRRQLAGLWLVIALGCMLFSLGPLFKVNNSVATYTLGTEVNSNIVMPWAFFQKLPFLNATRTPGRFNLTTGLAIGILAAIGLDVLLQRLRPTRQLALALALAALALAEYQVMIPFPTTPVTVPEYFKELSSRTDVRAVLNVPTDSWFGQKSGLSHQVVHQHPLIAGYISRVTPVDNAKLSLLSDVAFGRAYSPMPELAQLTPDVARTVFGNFGADVVVYHWFLTEKELAQQAAKSYFGLPAFTDGNITIHEIPPPQSPVDASVLTFSNQGWWRRTPADTLWLKDDAAIYLYVPTEQDRQWTLELLPLLKHRHLQLMVDGQLTHSWEISTPSEQINFWLHLKPGIHTLRFITPEGCTPVPVIPMCLVDGKSNGKSTTDPDCQLRDNEKNLCVSIALDRLKAKDSGDMALQPKDIHLSGSGTNWTLQGVRLPTHAELGKSIVVETIWQVTKKPVGDNHLFIHILDSDGELAAQYDSIPGGSTFATSKWSDNQKWIETAGIEIPASLKAGTYSVYTGWYSFPDLTRLKVDASTPRAQDGLVYLSDIEIK